MTTPIVNEIMRKLNSLPDNLQRQVLLFVDALHVSSIRGKPGKTMLKFVGTIPNDDLELIEKAIQEGCEKIDDNEW